MPYGDPINSPLPVVQTTVGPDYAAQLRAWGDEVQVILEAKVTPAGFDFNSTLDANSNRLYSNATYSIRYRDRIITGC